MKTILIFIVCCFGLPTLLAAQQRVLLEYLSSQQSGIVPEAHRYIEELEQEFGDRLIPINYYDNIPVSSTIWGDLSMEFRVGLPIQTITAGINRRRDVFPSSNYKGMTVERWHPFITSLLEEEPILEIVPRRMQFDNSTGMSIFKVEYSIIWHKPDSNIFLNFMLLQDSLQGARLPLRQRNNFDTVQGHPFFGKGAVIEDYMARNVAIAGFHVAYPNKSGGDTIRYTGQDTVHLVKFASYYSKHFSEIFDFTSDSSQYRFIIYACKVQRYFSHPTIVDSSHVPIINVARINGRDFEFNTITSVQQSKDVRTAEQLLLYPNPATNWVTVRHPADMQGGTISIADFLGRNVANHTIGLGMNSQISLANLPNGFYTLQLRHNNTIQTSTLIVRK